MNETNEEQLTRRALSCYPAAVSLKKRLPKTEIPVRYSDFQMAFLASSPPVLMRAIKGSSF